MAKKILIADDSILMRQMIRDTVENVGWHVIAEAADGFEAVEMYNEHQPDLVTMDIVMPGSDGIEALEKILAIDPDAKIVVVSALNQTKVISEAIRKGARDFIAKPFMPEQLIETVEQCWLETAAI
jgi:two-component system, chemotaxis family, chemotaxis protein CheY